MADGLIAREMYRLEHWKKVISAQGESRHTVKEFCSERGISPRSYYYWLRKLRDAAVEQMQHEANFVEFPCAEQLQNNTVLRIEYGSAKLELPGDVDMNALAGLPSSLQNHGRF